MRLQWRAATSRGHLILALKVQRISGFLKSWVMTSHAEFVFSQLTPVFSHQYPITGKLLAIIYMGRASCTVTYHRFHECLMIHGHQQFGKQIQIEELDTYQVQQGSMVSL